jgi:MoxR-like ATPase
MSDADRLVHEIEALGDRLAEAKSMISRRFIGQTRVVDLTLTALLCGGHGLLVGVPGLGKTMLVDSLGQVMGLSTGRVQFTPDLMPADILGSEVLETGRDGARAFRFIEGPVFCQLLMADEINRASPRTQSALLQAMQEGQVTASTGRWGSRSMCWRPRTRSSRKAPIPCPRRSLTGSSCRSTSTTRRERPSVTF